MRNKIPSKSLKNGFSLPVYGLGTWEMGGRYESDSSHDEEDIAAIRSAIDHGITHIDTAEMYGDGHSEELVGRAIMSYDRSTLFITSKVWKTHLRYDDVLKACERSLTRLQTDHLDLYLIHSANDEIPLSETVKALNTLQDKGLIKNIGVSNFAKERLAEAQKLSKYPIVCNQVHYNVMYRDPETTGLLEYCQNNDVLLTCFRPLGKRDDRVLSTIQSLQPIADKYNKTPMQIALNWLISQKNVIVISKTTQEKHLEENLKSVDWNMEDSDIEYIRKSIPIQPDEEFSLR
ncbi:aldo/keto reductase [Candidatus Roizmanbacteria bacterium]|nr:aldo/keto reductase [Candidatus Roizmanbacteria bacterium]